VIEVAETSVRKDRAKAAIYAGAGIAVYWIINPLDSQVEVYRDPHSSQRTYASRETLTGDDVLRLELDGHLVWQSQIKDILPPGT
jgi:Uma2 family endonuclease